jgi:hypothetical protein
MSDVIYVVVLGIAVAAFFLAFGSDGKEGLLFVAAGSLVAFPLYVVALVRVASNAIARRALNRVYVGTLVGLLCGVALGASGVIGMMLGPSLADMIPNKTEGLAGAIVVGATGSLIGATIGLRRQRRKA